MIFVDTLTLLIASNPVHFCLPFCCRGQRKRKRNRQKQYYRDVISNFRMDEFKLFFRISRISAERLIAYIQEVCADGDEHGIIGRVGSGGSTQKPLEQRVLATLWFLASQDKYASIADRFNFSESTACDAVRNLLRFFSDKLLDKLIKWPTPAEQQAIAAEYNEKKKFPGVIGMIDGTHIAIKKPKERGIDYYNRKDYYSMVLQAVAKDDLQFTDIYTGWPGKVHDARVFRNSPLFECGQQICGDYHILADSAYPNLGWVLTPYRDNGHLSRAQRNFNFTHSSIRSVVERAFGLLKGRFTRLRIINQGDTETIISTIVSACILHNICIKSGDDFVEALEDDAAPQNLPQGDDMNFAANLRQEGGVKRDRIAADLLINTQ